MYGGPYRAKRFWLGGLNQAAVSFYLGAPLAVNVIAANESEATNYPELYEKLLAATGGVKPDTVIGDRGLSIKHVFEFNTIEGVVSVFPWRKPRADITRESLDTDDYDRHDVPRCKHCGGPGDITGPGLGHVVARGKPRLRFKCEHRPTQKCRRSMQSIACERDYRLLTPLSQRSQLYHSLSSVSKEPRGRLQALARSLQRRRQQRRHPAAPRRSRLAAPARLRRPARRVVSALATPRLARPSRAAQQRGPRAPQGRAPPRTLHGVSKAARPGDGLRRLRSSPPPR